MNNVEWCTHSGGTTEYHGSAMLCNGLTGLIAIMVQNIIYGKYL